MARRILPHAPSTVLADALLAMGEVVVDETTGKLRVGDGATLGGNSPLDTIPPVQLAAADAVPIDIATAVKPIKSVLNWGVVPDGAMTAAAMRVAVGKAWNAARAGKFNLYFPKGRYDIGEYSWPWRATFGDTVYYDCYNVTIHGDGPETVFTTSSAEGADVFQLDKVKNLHFRNLAIEATLSTVNGSGSNGISITGGYDNITFDGIWITNMPGLDKWIFTISSGVPVPGNVYTINGTQVVCESFSSGRMRSHKLSGNNIPPNSGTLTGTPSLTYTAFDSTIDGGKGLSLQLDTAILPLGTLKATRLFVKGCAQGFGLEIAPTQVAANKLALDIELVAEDCYVAVTVGGAAAEAAVTANAIMGVNVELTAINCQKDVQLGRVHGIRINGQIVTTKSAAARRLDPNGVLWAASQPTVESLLASYVRNAHITLRGNKGECDYKAGIGGTGAGSSSLPGYTFDSTFLIDLGGTPTGGNPAIREIDSGGNSLNSSRLMVTAATLGATAMPTAFYLPSRNNVITIGTYERLMGVMISGDIMFTRPTDGKSALAYIGVHPSAELLFSRQVNSSAAGALIHAFYNDGNTRVAGIRNDGALHTKAATSGAPTGTAVGKMPVYDDGNTLIGYVELKNLT